MKIMLIVALVLLSAFFSSAETALSGVNRIRLKNMAASSKAAERALNILQKYDKALSTILIGNNIVNIATSSIATIVAIRIVGEEYGSLAATVAVTFVVLVFGEILPKSLAKDYAEELCVGFSGVLSFLMIVFTPLSAFFTLLKKGFTKLFGKKQAVSVTEEELMVIIDEIEDEGVLEQQEGNLVRSALMFDEITVDEIITPRVAITAVDANADAEELRGIFLKERFSRVPVYEKTLDHIIGIVTEKDFFREYETRGAELSVRELMQETLFFPHLLKISEVLKTMQKEKCHMSVIIDQHGGTLGIVTMEDILEELVGEIWDESDEVRLPVTPVADGVFEVLGEVSLNSLRRYFSSQDIDVTIDSESRTVAGWVLELFSRIPQSGETTDSDSFEVTVLEASQQQHKVNKVLLALKKEV